MLADPHGFHVVGAGPRRRRAAAQAVLENLAELWTQATGGNRLDGVALACVGSLARQEMGPLSDLDLVLLHSESERREITELADRLWYPLWDNGIRFDHSVRTLAQCREAAGRDLSAAVGLLDLTRIAGDETIVAAARSTTAHDWRKHARTRLPELVESLYARHRREGDLSQLIDPDLKEAKGGLRDMGILRALTAAWLADRPHGDVDAAYEHLLDVRDALHVVTGRSRERLGREEQDNVAAVLGIDGGDELLAGVSESARLVAYSLDGTLRRATQARQARTLRIAARRPQLSPLGHGLFLHDGEVVLGPGADPAKSALLPIRAALAAARAGATIAPRTLDNLAAHAPALPVPWTQATRDVFTDLLATGPALVPVWEGLDIAGLVTSWLPAWRDIRCRPQRSPVHRHTVDRHLIETVVMANEYVRDVRRPDLLVLAALLHDIGKVAGAVDHSAAGAVIAEEALTRMGYLPSDRALVVGLVREHLTLVDLATRRDVRDPATIERAVAAVEADEEALVMLRALSQADARAVGGQAWSTWRATLLADLCDAARQTVRDGSPVAAVAGRPAQPDGEIISVSEQVAAHGGPVIRVDALDDAFRVLIGTADRPGLFADLAGWFAAHGFGVRSALLQTVAAVAVDVWTVTTTDGQPPVVEDLTRDLRRLDAGDPTPLRRLTRRRASTTPGRSASSPETSTRVLVLPDASTRATVLEVRTTDRTGLLHQIGRALSDNGISVSSAHVGTYAGQAVDTFYVTTGDDKGGRGGPLTPAATGRAIAVIVDACDGG